MTNYERRIYPTPDALAAACAALMLQVARGALATRGRFSVALPGGSTPLPVFEALVRDQDASTFDWEAAHVFFGDERCVPPDHADSNYAQAKRALLDPVGVPAAQVYRMRGELEPVEAASEYEAVLTSFFGGAPRFDLVLLGLGSDAHTASLFPHSPALTTPDTWVAVTQDEAHTHTRLTLTPRALNGGRTVVFVASGPGKAQAVARTLTGDAQPTALPAQLIRPADGALLWLLDEAAAAFLPR